MADLRFKIQQLDAGAAHWLGWAKKEVRRLAELMPAFTRTWVHGDVTVRAQYHEESGIARLWLEAQAKERMYAWAALDCPEPYTRLQRHQIAPVELGVGGPDLSLEEDVINAYHYVQTATTTFYRSHSGAVSFVGTKTVSGSSVEYIDFPVDAAPAIVAAWETFGTIPALLSASLTGQPLTGWVNYQSMTANLYLGRPFVVIPDPEVAEDGARVYTSDGEELSKETITRSADVGLNSWAMDDATQSVWNWLRFVKYGVASTFDHIQEYQIPASCAFAPVGVYDTSEEIPIPAELSNTDLSIETYRQLQFAAHSAWREHVWSFFTAAMMALKAALKDKTFVLPAQWATTFQLNAPTSEHLKRDKELTVSYVDTVLVPGFDATIKRTVTATYIGKDENGNEETKAFEVVGYWQRYSVPSHNPLTGAFITNTVRESFDNWYEQPSDFLVESAYSTEGIDRLFTVTPYMRHTMFIDSAERTVGQLWSGTVTAAETDTYHSDSSYGALAPQIYTHVDGAKVWLANELTPPLEPYINTLQSTVPEFFSRYAAEHPPKYVKDYVQTEQDKVWMATRFAVGGTVTVVFLAPETEYGECGSFMPVIESMRGIIALRLVGKATWVYKKEGNTFTLSAYQELDARIVLPETVNSLPGNALLIYGGLEWSDLKERAKAQREALKDPDDPEHDPLMKAVLDALNSSSP